VLHVAVLRRRHDLAGALLEAGFPVALANARKWAPVDEAIALNDKRMVRPRHSLCDCPGRRSWQALVHKLLAQVLQCVLCGRGEVHGSQRAELPDTFTCVCKARLYLLTVPL